jgi:hypothetical protein
MIAEILLAVSLGTTAPAAFCSVCIFRHSGAPGNEDSIRARSERTAPGDPWLLRVREQITADTVRTPAPGTAERRAILDALRAEMRRFDRGPVEFVVRHLRVQSGWAWLAADPRSPGGRARYEREGALLVRRAGRWQVVARMPAGGEREGTPLERECAWFAHLLARFPSVPRAVLPAAGQAACPR